MSPRTSGQLTDAEWWTSVYGSSFLEDVELGIMPIGGRSSLPSFFIRPAATAEASVDTLIRTISGKSPYYSRELASVVCDWIVDCAQTVVMYGRAEYHIIHTGPSDVVIQRVHHDDAGEQNLEHTVIGSGACVMPREGARALTVLRKVLAGLHGPVAVLDLLDPPNAGGRLTVPFDHEAYRREEAHVLARATAFTGWNARGMFHPDHGQNAYHFVYRELKFHHFKALLRRLALACLNDCLHIAGGAVGVSMLVDVLGLPTEGDAEQALRQLEEGQSAFSELLEPFKL